MSHLHVDSIQKSFNRNQILTDVYLQCSTGEVVGLLGRNGTGKSTLMKIISGLMKADFKYVKVDDLVILKPGDNYGSIAYLPQKKLIPSHIKIKRALQLYCPPMDIEKIQTNTEILPLLQKRPNQLSGGELRYIEIILVLFSKAKFCLLDEPFKGVAPIYKERISDLIKVRSHDKGIVISDHDYRNVLKTTSRNYILNDGGIYEVKNMEDLRSWNYIR